METAQSIILDALQEILVQASEMPLEAADFQTARRYLNRMMSSTPFEGLGFTQVTNPDDVVTIPDAAIEGVIFNLAKRLLTTYDMPLTNELAMNARTSLQEIYRLTSGDTITAFPCTLPTGSGNDDYDDLRFYPCPEDEGLTEQNGALLLETNT